MRTQKSRPNKVLPAGGKSLWLARWLAFRKSRLRRHQILNAIGPLLLPTLVAIVIALLMIGYALIYWPHLPESSNVNKNAESPRWIEALYFSGTTLTTLGNGDIAPRSSAMRLVALSEASAGFVSISLAVTYLITVAGALEKRIVASSFYHQAEGGADAAGFIARYFDLRFSQTTKAVGAVTAREAE